MRQLELPPALAGAGVGAGARAGAGAGKAVSVAIRHHVRWECVEPYLEWQVRAT